MSNKENVPARVVPLQGDGRPIHRYQHQTLIFPDYHFKKEGSDISLASSTSSPFFQRPSSSYHGIVPTGYPLYQCEPRQLVNMGENYEELDSEFLTPQPSDLRQQALKKLLDGHFRVEYKIEGPFCDRIVYLKTLRSINSIREFRTATATLQKYGEVFIEYLEKDGKIHPELHGACNTLGEILVHCERKDREKFNTWLRRVKLLIEKVESIGGEIWRAVEANKSNAHGSIIINWLQSHPDSYLTVSKLEIERRCQRARRMKMRGNQRFPSVEFEIPTYIAGDSTLSHLRAFRTRIQNVAKIMGDKLEDREPSLSLDFWEVLKHLLCLSMMVLLLSPLRPYIPPPDYLSFYLSLRSCLWPFICFFLSFYILLAKRLWL